jgi:cytochrome bd ubiquinol oxidase subunit II
LMLLAGLGSVIYGVAATGFLGKNNGIWFGGIGTVLVGLAIFSLAGYNNTAFYPSLSDLQSSLTIHNASSSKYTLTVMSYVALAVPFVLAYVAYVWKLMDAKKLTLAEITGEDVKEMY